LLEVIDVIDVIDEDARTSLPAGASRLG